MEILDIVDELGNPTGSTVERKIAHKEGILHRTSHVWIVREHNSNLQILLQQRSFQKDSFPGMYDISSAGHIPSGCGYRESVIRELKEELNVDANPKDLVECGIRRIQFTKVFNGNEFHENQVSKVFYFILDQDKFKVQESEVEGTLWMDFEKCMSQVKEDKIPHCISIEELQMVFQKYQQIELEK